MILATSPILAQTEFPIQSAFNKKWQQSLYVENAMDLLKDRGNLGEIFNIKAFTETYERYKKSGVTFSQAEMQDFLNKGGSDIDKFNALATSLSTYNPGGNIVEYAKAASTLAGTMANNPVAKVASTTTNALLDVGSRAAKTVFGPTAQRNAQGEVVDYVHEFNEMGRTELSYALTLANQDPEFKAALDAYLAPRVQVNIDTPADQILTSNKKLQNNVLIRNLKTTLDQMAEDQHITTDELKQFLSQDNALTTKSVEASVEVLSKIAEIKKGINDANKRAQAEQDLQQKQIALNNAIQDAHAATDIITTFVGFDDPKLAHFLSTSSHSTIQIVGSIKQFSLGSMSATVMTGNIVGAVMSFSSLFGEAEPSIADILVPRLNALQEQISNLHQAMEYYFKRVDARLDNIYTTLQNGIYDIKTDIRHVDQKLDGILDNMGRARDQLYKLNEAIDRRFLALTDENKSLAYNKVLGWKDLHGKSVSSITKNDLDEGLTNFYTWSTVWSKDAIHSGILHTHVNEKTLSDVEQMENVFAELNNPIERLQLIAKLCSILGNKEVAPTNDGMLPNGLIWMLGSESYLRALKEWDEMMRYEGYTPQGQLNDMIGIGQEVHQAIQAITLDRASKQPKREFFHTIIDLLGIEGDRLDNALKDVERKFRQERNISDDLEKFHFWNNPGQATEYLPTNLVARDRNHRGPDIPITARIVSAFVPNGLLAAEELGLGYIKFVWDYEEANPNESAEIGRVNGILLYAGLVPNDVGKKILGPASELSKTDELSGLVFTSRASLRGIPIEKGSETAKVNSFIKDNWMSGLNLAERFVKDFDLRYAKYQNDQGYAGHWLGAVSLNRRLEEYMQPLRRKLADTILNVIRRNTGGIRDESVRFRAVNRIVRSIIELGLSRSTQSNDSLRAILYGKKHILDAQEILDNFTRYYTEIADARIEERSQELNNWDNRLKQIVKENPTFDAFATQLIAMYKDQARPWIINGYGDGRDPDYSMKGASDYRRGLNEMLEKIIVDQVLINGFSGEPLSDVEMVLARLGAARSKWNESSYRGEDASSEKSTEIYRSMNRYGVVAGPLFGVGVNTNISSVIRLEGRTSLIAGTLEGSVYLLGDNTAPFIGIGGGYLNQSLSLEPPVNRVKWGEMHVGIEYAWPKWFIAGNLKYLFTKSETAHGEPAAFRVGRWLGDIVLGVRLF